jgi:hypothetical protein
MSERIQNVLPLQCEENSACSLTGLSVRDVDAGERAGGTLLVVLTCVNGTLSIDPLLGSSDSGSSSVLLSVTNGLGTNTLTLVLPAVNIESTLDDVIYTPKKDYYGSDTITIHVDDQGNTGLGPLCSGITTEGTCRLTDTLVQPVVITGRPDWLEISIPHGIVNTEEDRDVTITGINIINHEKIPEIISFGTGATTGGGRRQIPASTIQTSTIFERMNYLIGVHIQTLLLVIIQTRNVRLILVLVMVV